ncbi:MAG: hypothetical protein JWO12_316 [Frankiales bacterium]|nr:hypothetical protein [Frankiales bacterium]
MREHAAHLLPLLVAAAVVSGASWRAVRTTAPGRAAQLIVAAALLAAAAVHVSAAQHHLGTQRSFFAAVAAGQLALSVATLLHPSRTVGPVVLSSLALLVLWLESRTVGIGYGIEPVGTADVLAGGLELLALIATRWLRCAGSRRTALTGEVAAWALIVVAGSLAAAS